jgi:hypothetical protein
MNIGLWVLQVLLGLFFIFHSYLMLRPPQMVQSGMKYVLEMPAALASSRASRRDWRASL